MAYENEELIAAPRSIVWKLLEDHLDDTKIRTIHPLVLSQKTVERTGSGVQLERVIDVGRKPKKSRWMIAYAPPDHAHWEVLESEGPWASGSYLDVRYEEVPGGTHVVAWGALSVRDPPLFVSQKRAVAQLLKDLDAEDFNYLNRYRF